eukprot:TRINITY_DN5167_c1_g1_i1.p1 TRINITY_DN5167_c1_g1~~TRINITY_DN5167_c1_g1_i1.p1  ORF type:complete len:1214 (+),score=204.02 TRINITY_DN5167_c1_g1_i1:151-3792(+)
MAPSQAVGKQQSAVVASLEPGTLVWLRDEAEVWRAGKVEKNGAAEVGVRLEKLEKNGDACVNEEIILVPLQSKGQPPGFSRNSMMNTPRRDFVEGPSILMRSQELSSREAAAAIRDLASLRYLHEAEMLNVLQQRYEQGDIYIFTGPILLAVNPFRQLPRMYDLPTLKSFLTDNDVRSQPHIFSIANAAFNGIRNKGISQTVLVSGESGAGKTETTKFAMQFLAVAGGHSEANAAAMGSSTGRLAPVHRKVTESNPLLEAFGNAKTLRNDNSSRFGKYIELQFAPPPGAIACREKRICLTGGRIRTYLLEKVRVCNQQEGERCFHIFYQALHAAKTLKPGEKVYRSPALLELGNDEKFAQVDMRGFSGYSLESFEYLTRSSCRTLQGLEADEAASFEGTLSAMATVGFDTQGISQVLRALAAILHLGNISFTASHSESSAVLRSPDPERCSFTIACELLGVSQSDLEVELCTKTRRAPGERMIRSHLSTELAAEARDALARHLYGAIFLHIVAQANKSLDFQAVAAGGSGAFCGVLDIFGFEFFKVNSFEQLCINFTNELLQQYFNAFIFEHEAELYNREGIPWDPADFPDNGSIVELLKGNPEGIMAMLDEECITVAGTAKNWERKLQAKHAKNSHFSTKPNRPGLFDIRHFAGPVSYTVDQFLEKNKDQLSENLTQLLKDPTHCTNEFISNECFAGELNRVFGVGASEGRVTKAKTYTVSLEFREQLDRLMDTIKSTAPHFVRCLKPNPRNVPHELSRAQVIEQLRYQGVLQVVQVSRAGYPVRVTLQEFWQEYRVLLPLQKQYRLETRPAQERAKTLMTNLEALLPVSSSSSNGQCWAVGRTQVFLKQEPANTMQGALLERRRTAVTKLAAACRKYIAVRKFQNIRRVVIRLQALARCKAACVEISRRRRDLAAVKIQKRIRGCVARLRYAKVQKGVVVMQSLLRMRILRRSFLATKRSVIKLQKWLRITVWKRRWRNLLRNVQKVQSCWRSHCGRRLALEQLVLVRRRMRAVRVLLRLWRVKVATRIRKMHMANNPNGAFSQATRGQLCAALGAVEKDAKSLRCEQSRLQARNAEQDAALVERGQALEKRKQERASLSERVSELTRAQVGYDKKITRLLQEHARLGGRVAEMEEAAKVANREMAQIVDEKVRLRSRLDVAERENARHVQENAKCNTRIVELEDLTAHAGFSGFVAKLGQVSAKLCARAK